MRNLFIVNDHSSHPLDVDVMRERAESSLEGTVEFAHIGGKNDFHDAIRNAGESGEEVRVFACGGDGTLNAVIQDTMNYDNLSVTNLACGTGNDYLKRFDRPEVFRKVESFSHVDESNVDVIRLNDRYSANVVCFGFDARVCETYERLRPIKFIGRFGYHIGCVLSILRGVFKPCRVELDDGFVHDDDVTLVCVCNNGWYGGSYNPSPEANVKDGMLDVIICKRISRLTMIRIISKYKKGQHSRISPKILEYHRVKSLRIIPKEPSPFNLDGELIIADSAEIEVLPGRMRFFHPSSVREIDP